MSTELANITDLNSVSYEQLAAMTGADTGGGNGLTRLAINYDSDDEDGNTLPRGAFVVEYEGRKVFSNSANPPTFRVFFNQFQYVHYDPEADNGKGGKGVYVNKSLQHPTFRNVQFLDEKGGIKCGKIKVDDDVKKTLSPAQLKLQDEVSAYRILYGLLTMDGLDAKGTAVKIENLPVVWKLRGSNFLPFDEQVTKPLAKAKRLFLQTNLSISTKREKNGATVFYVAQFAYDKASPLVSQEGDFEILKAFDETIRAENAEILAKHNAVLRGKPNAEDDENEKIMSAAMAGQGGPNDPMNEKVPW